MIARVTVILSLISEAHDLHIFTIGKKNNYIIVIRQQALVTLVEKTRI